ncbi:MAG: hypothetical protein JKY46_06110 [Robiginitomaculum sp.]|nr:hypothetical protein [Robiginitomaculum sp.]
MIVVLSNFALVLPIDSARRKLEITNYPILYSIDPKSGYRFLDKLMDTKTYRPKKWLPVLWKFLIVASVK